MIRMYEIDIKNANIEQKMTHIDRKKEIVKKRVMCYYEVDI
jgi:hypothetical protein